MIQEIHDISLIDGVLASVLLSANGGTALPPGLKMAGGTRSMLNSLPNNAAVQQFPGLEGMETGQEIYDFWQKMADLATQRAKACTGLYNESASRVIALEDQRNSCYRENDELTKLRDASTAQKGGLLAKIGPLQRDIESMEGAIKDLKDRIKELEEKKRIYDVLKWIPFVNLISEIVAAIDGTREELSRKQNELSRRSHDLSALCREYKDCSANIDRLTLAISQNQMQAKALEEQIKSCQAQRDAASKEMIAWKDREQYYLNVAGEMEHLIAMEAGAEEFKKLIADNPPPFQLAA